jgi:transcriptional regulator with PAS, ATPase and Fis domain
MATRVSPLGFADNPEFIMVPADLMPEAASVLAVAVLLKALPVGRKSLGIVRLEVASVMKERLEALVEEMLEQNVRLEDAMEEFEKRFIQTALARSCGNQCNAAALLHVHRNTLARKIVHYKIRVNR